eukprot:1039508-Pyramimonas_sp.AAC.1
MQAKGCPGLDGWTFRERCALKKHFPTTLREFYDTWILTSREAVHLQGRLPDHVRQFVFGRRRPDGGGRQSTHQRGLDSAADMATSTGPVGAISSWEP